MSLQQKIKLLQKLIDAGYTTEKEISGIDTKEFLDIFPTNVNDIRQAVKLQEAIKNKQLFAWLTEDMVRRPAKNTPISTDI